MSKPWERPALLALAALAVLAALPAADAGAEDLEEILTEVGTDYARAYLAPFSYSIGPNLNSGVYNTAAIAS